MAISKIKPIRVTLRKAIDYIINPEKTQDGLLVSSCGCSPETADLEMKIIWEYFLFDSLCKFSCVKVGKRTNVVTDTSTDVSCTGCRIAF